MAISRPEARLSSTNSTIIGYLRTRRTIPAPQLAEPGPDVETLRTMLTIAARVPDHGKLAPWRFIVYGPTERQAAVAALAAIAGLQADERERAKRAEQAKTFGAAPLVVAVVSRAAEHPKIPVWEQQLSAGAVCVNLIHAAHAHGLAAQWLTGWYAYEPEAAAYLGIGEGERLAGFVHIGTAAAPPAERDRPDIDAITSVWRPPAGR